MNAGLECGDFEVIVSDHPQNLEEAPETCSSPSDKKIKTLYVSNVTSGTNPEYAISKRVQELLPKTEKLNDLVNYLKEAETTPIEVLVNNELFAISLLKNEIRSAKEQIDDVPDADEVEINEKKNEVCDSQPEKHSSADVAVSNDPNIRILERHIYLQEEALSLLTNKIQKTEELLVKEAKASEELRIDKESLSSEVSRLKVIEEKYKDDCQKLEKLKIDPEYLKLGNRPFKTIKELKAQLEEKDKTIAIWKSKFSRSEAVHANKATLLENEKKKNADLEAKIKNLNSRIKVSTTQINSLQYLNNQLKEQMGILKNQMNGLTHDKPATVGITKSEIGEHFIELAEILKNQDARVRTLREEADDKLRQVEKNHFEEINRIRQSLEKSEKINLEYLKTIKELLRATHEYAIEKEIKLIDKPSYGRVREILGISRAELDLLFSVYAKNSSQEELDNWFEECINLIDKEEGEFALKLSSWLFDTIRRKLEVVNNNENKKENENES